MLARPPEPRGGRGTKLLRAPELSRDCLGGRGAIPAVLPPGEAPGPLLLGSPPGRPGAETVSSLVPSFPRRPGCTQRRHLNRPLGTAAWRGRKGGGGLGAAAGPGRAGPGRAAVGVRAGRALTSACCRGSAPAPRSRRRTRQDLGSALGAAGPGCRRPQGSLQPPTPGAARGAPRRPSAPPSRPSPAGRRPPLSPASRAPSAPAEGPRGPPTAESLLGAGTLRSGSGGTRCRAGGGGPSGSRRTAQGRPGAAGVLCPAEKCARSERVGPGPGGAGLRRGAPAGWAA